MTPSTTTTSRCSWGLERCPREWPRGTFTTAVVSINDNEDDPDVSVSFGSATYSAVEGFKVAVTVGLSAAPERTVVIPITTTNQNGASSGDYSGVPASVTFNSLETTKIFRFTAVHDNVNDAIEIGESVQLAFGESLPEGGDRGHPGDDCDLDQRCVGEFRVGDVFGHGGLHGVGDGRSERRP